MYVYVIVRKYYKRVAIKKKLIDSCKTDLGDIGKY